MHKTNLQFPLPIESLLSEEFKGQSGIIYTLTIKDVETLSKDLRSRGIRVGPYHANLDPEFRSNVHKKWLNGSYQAVIATIAFGKNFKSYLF